MPQVTNVLDASYAGGTNGSDSTADGTGAGGEFTAHTLSIEVSIKKRAMGFRECGVEHGRSPCSSPCTRSAWRWAGGRASFS